MRKSFNQIVKDIFYHFKDYVSYENISLPAPTIRTGGEEFKNDQYYVQSASNEANRIFKHFSKYAKPKILDMGCGYGRLPIGFLLTKHPTNYIGMDVNSKAISWCQKHISAQNSDFEFIYLNLHNDRYNPSGTLIDEQVKLPLQSKFVDIIYLYSVFSHMTDFDIEIYLDEFNRVLKPNGHIFFTAFSEKNVPEMSINPQDYQSIHWEAPLHCVRFNHDYLTTLIHRHGFQIDLFEYGQETNGQSAFYLSKSNHSLP